MSASILFEATVGGALGVHTDEAGLGADMLCFGTRWRSLWLAFFLSLVRWSVCLYEALEVQDIGLVITNLRIFLMQMLDTVDLQIRECRR